jgi:hypothetical protein
MNYVWYIAYIDSKFYAKAGKELKRFPIKDICIYQPRVSIVRKIARGKQTTVEVPLMFNYGFVMVPKGHSKSLFNKLKSDISCISGWLYDYTKKNPKVCQVSAKEVESITEMEGLYDIYDNRFIEALKPGMFITLQGYPYDDLPVEVKHIDYKSKKIQVSLVGMKSTLANNITVDFSHVYYSVYNSDYKERSLNNPSLDEFLERRKDLVDRLMYNNNFVDYLNIDDIDGQ